MERWMHDALDIICFGRSYWWLHKRIDEKSIEMGPSHRAIAHGWYQKFKKSGGFQNPFPIKELNVEIPEILEAVPLELKGLFKYLAQKETVSRADRGLVKEAYRVYVSHCFFDRMWDELSWEERRAARRFVINWIRNPQLLLTKSGVDVARGRIRVKKNGEEWKSVPSLRGDYRNLLDIISNYQKISSIV